jgi:ribonuclease HII|tara:strand:- start:64 stop:405 length:342 start_codon:yes stop_codon:yes gene_type:complete
MQRALKKLKFKPSIAFIDGLYKPKNIKIKCKTIVKGDEKNISIAAASIIAKTARDLFMIKLSKKYPQYMWDKNFGYGTADHLKSLKKYGVTKHHRKKFAPVHNILMNKKRKTL